MTERLHLRVRGLPAPQGSKRHVGNGVMIESAGTRLKSWREDVRMDARAALDAGGTSFPSEGVGVSITFGMPRPRSHYRTGRNAHLLKSNAPEYCAKRPDIDKLVRSTLDALKSAGVYNDDSQVVRLVAEKQYASDTGATITVVQPAAHLI